MAVIRISDMPPAGPLDGSEELPIVQDGGNRKVTAAEFVTLVDSSPVDSVNGETGAVVLDAADVGATPASHVDAALGPGVHPIPISTLIPTDPVGDLAVALQALSPGYAVTDLDTDALNYATLYTDSEVLGQIPIQAALRNFGGREMIHNHGATGAAETIDLALGNVHVLTQDQACNYSFAGFMAGTACTVVVVILSTVGASIWPATVKWASDVAPLWTGRVRLYFTSNDGGVTIDAGKVGDLYPT